MPYELASEKGMFRREGGRIVLSESKARGPGRPEGDLIVFEYEYGGVARSIIYERDDATVRTEPRASLSEVKTSPRAVPVKITIEFPSWDATAGWINTIDLAPGGLGRAKNEALASAAGR